MRAYPLPLRERAVRCLERGWSAAHVARDLGVSAASIRRWDRQWRRTGQLQPRRGSGRSRLIRAEQEAALVEQIRRFPTCTLAQQCRMWEAARGVRVSVTTLSRSIRRLGWTRQRRPSGPV